jgi:hypothetical protein
MAVFAVYVLKGIIKFAKIRNGCRYSVYELAETCHGKVRDGTPDDGIYYADGSPHLSFQLVFTNETQAESFESGVLRIPQNYRKRNMPDPSLDAPDIEVQSVLKIASNVELQRIFSIQYGKEAADTDGSPEFDMLSHSRTSAVFVDEEVRLRMIE